MNTIAKILSFILGPQIWLPLLIFIFIFYTKLPVNQKTILMPALLLFLVIIPFFAMVIAYKLGKITDLDLTKREERIKPVMIMFFCFLSGWGSVFLFGNRLLLNLYSLFFILFVINGIITLFWKISFHMTVNIAGTILVNYLFGWRFPWLYLSIPLIFWARYILKKHTISQLVSAAVLNSTIIFFYLRFVRI